MTTTHNHSKFKLIIQKADSLPNITLFEKDIHYWHNEKFTIVATGQATKWQGDGKERFQEAKKWWQNLQNEIIIDTNSDPEALNNIEIKELLCCFFNMTFSDKSNTKSEAILPEKTWRYDKNNNLWLFKIIDLSNRELVQISKNDTSNTKINTIKTYQEIESKISKNNYEKAIEKAIEILKTGELEKIVISKDTKIALPNNIHLGKSLKNLQKTNPKNTIFAINNFFGASPETLCRGDKNNSEIVILAGSWPKDYKNNNTDARRQLLEDSKNVQEHKLAVKSASDALEKILQQKPANPPIKVMAQKHIIHLSSTLIIEHKNINIIDIVSKLHPTAAVAGTPKKKALNYIEKLEKADRGFYSGTSGWVDIAGNHDWIVGVRCAQIINEKEIEIWAGGGIMPQSDVSNEIIERELKLKTILESIEY